MKANTEKRSQWILLRGLAREARHWGTFPAELEAGLNQVLQKQGRIAQVNCIDLPGSGRYSEMRSPITIPEITDFVRQKFLEIRQRQRAQGVEPAQECHLISISLGGMVASDWLQRWPDDFESAVLINSSFRGFSPIHHRLSLSSYRHFAAIALNRKDAKLREYNVLKLVSNRPEIYDQVAEAWGRLHLERPIHPENFARQLLAASIYEPIATAPDVPVLILNSTCDRMVSPSCSEVIAQKWNTDIRRHPSAGHDLPLDDAPWVIEQISSWLEKVRQG